MGSGVWASHGTEQESHPERGLRRRGGGLATKVLQEARRPRAEEKARWPRIRDPSFPSSPPPGIACSVFAFRFLLSVPG